MEKKITCLGCTHHYLCYSYEIKNYIIIDSGYEASKSREHINLEEEDIPHLMNLLQYYKKFMLENKANLSAGKDFDYYRFEIAGLAKIASEINEIAKLNRKT